MKFLNEYTSNVLGLSYKLYETTLGEILSNLNNEVYTKYNLEFFDFNSNDYSNFKRLFLDETRAIRDANRISVETNRKYLKLIFDKYAKNKELDITNEMNHSIKHLVGSDYLFAFETGFIDVEILPNGSWRLLDGFRRLFRNVEFTEEILNYKVLLRDFGELNDINWLNYMFVNNSWKLSYSSLLTELFSRGFLTSLYIRSNGELNLSILTEEDLNLINFYGYHDNIFCNHYVNNSELNVVNLKNLLLNNNCFLNDLKLITEMVNYFDNYEVIDYKKNKEVRGSFKNNNYYRFNDSVIRLMQLMISTVGYIRRYENKNNLDNQIITLDDLLGYLDTVDNKYLVKYFKLEVDGHILNNIASGHYKPFRYYILNKIGYTDLAKSYEVLKDIKLNNSINKNIIVDEFNLGDFKI